MPRKYTTTEWKEKFYEKYPDSQIEIIGEYIGINKRITCKCNVCNNQINPVAKDLMRYGNCSECSKYTNSTIAKTKTHEQFINDYYTKFPNSTIKITGEYKGYYESIECECTVCGNIWKPLARNLLRGNGCRICVHTNKVPPKKKTQQEFENDFYTKYPNSQIKIGKYNSTRKHINCKCNICNYEWNPLPKTLMKFGRCPNCFSDTKGFIYSGFHRIKTQEEFERDYYKKFPDSKIKIIGKYKGSQEKIECECTICKYKFTPKADNLMKGNGCKNCSNSKGNQLLENIMIRQNFEHKAETYVSEIGKFFDNSITQNSEIKFLFEYDGNQHFRNNNNWKADKEKFKKRIEYDNQKNIYCLKNNIPLLRIPYVLDPVKHKSKIEDIILNFIKTKKVPKEILDFYSKYDFSNYVDCVKTFENKICKNL